MADRAASSSSSSSDEHIGDGLLSSSSQQRQRHGEDCNYEPLQVLAGAAAAAPVNRAEAAAGREQRAQQQQPSPSPPREDYSAMAPDAATESNKERQRQRRSQASSSCSCAGTEERNDGADRSPSGKRVRRSMEFWYRLCQLKEERYQGATNADFLRTVAAGVSASLSSSDRITGTLSEQQIFGQRLKEYRCGKLQPFDVKRRIAQQHQQQLDAVAFEVPSPVRTATVCGVSNRKVTTKVECSNTSPKKMPPPVTLRRPSPQSGNVATPASLLEDVFCSPHYCPTSDLQQEYTVPLAIADSDGKEKGRRVGDHTGKRMRRTVDFWYDLCALKGRLDQQQASSNGDATAILTNAAFLRSHISGPEVRGTLSEQQVFGQRYKEYQEGKLQPSSRGVKRRASTKFPAVEQKIVEYITRYHRTKGHDRQHFPFVEKPEINEGKGLRWIDIKVVAEQLAAQERGEQYAQFKASDGWIHNVLKRNKLLGTLQQHFPEDDQQRRRVAAQYPDTSSQVGTKASPPPLDDDFTNCNVAGSDRAPNKSCYMAVHVSGHTGASIWRPQHRVGAITRGIMGDESDYTQTQQQQLIILQRKRRRQHQDEAPIVETTVEDLPLTVAECELDETMEESSALLRHLDGTP